MPEKKFGILNFGTKHGLNLNGVYNTASDCARFTLIELLGNASAHGVCLNLRKQECMGRYWSPFISWGLGAKP